MTLDDFFTLTEMNNGLVAPSRVQELVAVMQKESDSVIKNIGEATRQWQAVASTIAATENQECLDLFIQLDGLRFLVKWLKDAQKFGNDPKFDFVVESISHMLRALGKLYAGCEKQIDSEMWATVKDLLIHNSSKVQDGARVLCESSKEKVNGDASPSNVERSKASRDDEVGKSADIEGDCEHSKSSLRDDSLSGEPSCNEKDQESTRNDPVLSEIADTVHPDSVESRQNSDKKMNPAVGDDLPSPHIDSSSLVKPAVELLASNLTGATLKSCNSASAGQKTTGSAMNVQETELASEAKHATKIENSPRKLEESNTSECRSFPSSSDAEGAIGSVTESSSLKNPAAGCIEFSKKDSANLELRRNDSDGKGSVENSYSANQSRSSYATDVGDELKARTSRKSSSGNRSWGNTGEFGAFIAGIVDREKIKKHSLHTSNDNLASGSTIVKNVKSKEAEKAGKKSDIELLGMVDPLEVARQVAKEIKQEAVGYREHSGSVSEKPVDNHVQRPGSPDSVSRQSNAIEGSSKDVTSNRDSSAETSTVQEDSETGTKNPDAEQTDGAQNMATSRGADSRKGDDSRGKDPCNFDLNQEVLSEDADIPRNELSTPVAVVSASRAVAAVSGLPTAPLQFEGNLGWKGSAATSAFRRASPRRMPENEKDLCAEGSAGSSKPQQGCFDIDLNVFDGVDGRAEESSLFSTVPSGESNVNTTPRRSGQLELDLNHTTEDGARPNDWQMRQLFPLENGQNSGSHPSSSKLSSLKNIDLNDQPSFLHDSSGSSYLMKLSQNPNASGAPKSDNSVISLLGTRVEVNHKDGPQTVALSNGRNTEFASDVNSGRSGSYLAVGSPYAQSSVYGYNYMTPGPVPVQPFSSTMYGSGGPIPYMVDSRGTPVVPQLMGSASGMHGFSQTPFYMNMSNPMPSNGSGAPSRSSFDLNSGMTAEGGNRDPASFAQFLNLGPVKSMDEQMRSNAQTSVGPVVGGKRKEPDNGWDHYPFKHYTSPWK